MTYRQLQTALKVFREQGYALQVKLNASQDALQAEYNRLTAITTDPALEEATAKAETAETTQPVEPSTIFGNNGFWGLGIEADAKVVAITLGNAEAAKRPMRTEDDLGFWGISKEYDLAIAAKYQAKAEAKEALEVDFIVDAGWDALDEAEKAEYLEAQTTEVAPEQYLGPVLEMTADQFNAWVGLPTEPVVAIAVAIEVAPEREPETKPEPERTNDNKQTSDALVKAFSIPSKLPSETLKDTQNAYPAKVWPIRSIREAKTIRNIEKQPDESLESLQDNHLAISNTQQSSYWIDGTELGQRLESTQVQALRNLEDGLNWLKRLPGRLKAFEQGFREGWQDVPRRQASVKQPNVIPIDRQKRIQTNRTVLQAA